MGFLVACKNEEDPIKNEEARVVTTFFINFYDAQGQLTAKSVREFCRNSNSRKLLWLVLLSARMKKIHPKMKVLEWSQHFTHYKSMGIFPDAQGQQTHKSLVQSCRISNPFKIYGRPRYVCFSNLLKCLRSLYGKQCGPRSDCSRSSLFWVHTVCFNT